MLLDQRRRHVLELIEEKGFISLHELATKTGVSESTLRRDLEYLDGIRQVRRTRGGAAYVGESVVSLEERSVTSLVEKQRIARSISETIGSGETVLLDGGTTTLEVARALIGKELQVVTNSLAIANLLVNSPGVELIFLGGYLHPKTGVTLGPLLNLALSQLQVPRMVFSVGGVTEKGLFNSNTLLVEAERRMIDAAERVVLAVDSRKFGKAALSPLCPLDRVHEIVTDEGIPEDWRKRIEELGIELRIA
ncbi:DeoR/GlpR family DNA-binding transcription regulator [Planctopirus hydrillae]|uniref:DeoR family transcriptional regulator n=1 Tax=Planctopirus hydrillae TaxID=1841610 RepID=A0A1C3EHA5_9PLAN|nr:DeoR/GlpR family DNA-binding transcription regulator [Planctopirus hydrillae]ODA32621.1 DeoR family transcriptional regulator [Planctopirus hydrillae]